MWAIITTMTESTATTGTSKNRIYQKGASKFGAPLFFGGVFMSGRDERKKEINEKVFRIAERYPPYVKSYCLYLGAKESRTRNTYVQYVTNMIDFVGKEPQDITIDDLLLFMDKISQRKDGKETSGSYRVSVYHALKSFYDYLVVSGCVSENLMNKIGRPKPKPSDQVQRISLSQDDIAAYLYNVQNGVIPGSSYKAKRFSRLRDYAVIYLFISTGMRRSALAQANVEDFDSDEKTISVIEKGNKKRIFYLNDHACDAIRKWLRFRNENISTSSDALFVSREGKRLSDSATSDIIKKYSYDFGGRKITPHKLRAAYGKMIYEKTGDIYFVQSCMGHSSPKTTEIYVQADKKNTEKASGIIEDIFKGKYS